MIQRRVRRHSLPSVTAGQPAAGGSSRPALNWKSRAWSAGCLCLHLADTAAPECKRPSPHTSIHTLPGTLLTRICTVSPCRTPPMHTTSRPSMYMHWQTPSLMHMKHTHTLCKCVSTRSLTKSPQSRPRTHCRSSWNTCTDLDAHPSREQIWSPECTPIPLPQTQKHRLSSTWPQTLL